jgi:type VI secretion system protein ImpL
MSIKSLLLFLFLYVCLVWVGAALLHEGPDIRTFGLRWTAAGLIVVLAWIIISWAWGWFRVAKARSAAKPKSAAKPAPAAVALHEDDATLLALVEEAKISLARSANAPAQNVRFSDLPLYLLVGPEGAGKTSTFINSTLEPASLSGQPSGAGQTIPTRVCNIWLAKNALFIELGGRAFSGDLGRWASLLRTLRGGSTLSRWQRLLKEADSGLNLRGILAFGDVKEFMGASSPQGREKLDRLSGLWRDRLGAITEVFGRQYPVYWITTKTDLVPYFGDYFGRLRGTELGQIFGCTLPAVPPDGALPELASAQAENKRLTKSTSPLLHRLAERRVVHLAREEDPARKPGIYEFPREMRRIRPNLVQFLVDVFRPHPLRHTPFLRGYYFTGTCEEEIGFVNTGNRAALADDSVMSDASAVFTGDATQVFKSVESRSVAKPAGRASFTRRWAFVPELFTGVILRDNIVPRTVPVQTDQRVDLYRKVACGAVCFLCLLLCLCFLRSWFGNSQLLQSVNAANVSTTRNPTIDDLQALDKLHQQASLLSDYDRDGPPWRLRWGLYSGNAVVQPARDLYFRRFGEMLLYGMNDSILAKLKSVPDTAGVDDPNFALVSALLKTHLMISSGVCKPEPAFVSRLLKQTLAESNPPRGYDWLQLAGRQIDFYANELPAGNPVRIPEDTSTVQHTRGYLHSIQGPDRLYAALLSGAEKRFTTPQTLSALAANYGQVLNGSGEVSGVFTPEGWAYIKAASKDLKKNMPGDSCLEDATGAIAGYQQNAADELAIQRSFIHDYIERWRKFVSGFSVVRYSGAADAAHKLELLSDPKSPLLAVFALTSKNTYFPPAQPTALEKAITPITSMSDKLKETLGVKKDTLLPDGRQVDPTAEIVDAFKAVQKIVPGDSDTWVAPAPNKAYVDALSDLGHSLDAVAQNANNDPAVLQAAKQSFSKAQDAARQLEEQLPVSPNGLDTSIRQLLEEPLAQVEHLIPKPPDLTVKINGGARKFCSDIAATLHKFPFQASTQDASLDEFSRLFAPASGSVWKFQADVLADTVIKDGAVWKANPAAKTPVTQEMLNFLNRAQAVSDAFFSKGTSQPQLLYTLRPTSNPANQSTFVELSIDGQTYQWKDPIQQQFSWPAAPGVTGGAVGKLVVPGANAIPFDSERGVWAVFRLMRDAEPRLLNSKIVEWKYLRSGGGGGGGVAEAMSVPVRLEFVGFPGNADVFNPKFFADLQCSGRAVQQMQQ